MSILDNEGHDPSGLGNSPSWAELNRLRDEIARLREALKAARVHVQASNEAEHLMDGFGPRSRQASDGLLATIDEVLGADEQSANKE